MIQAVMILVLSPEKQIEALKILKPAAMRTRVKTGCLGCFFYRDSVRQ